MPSLNAQEINEFNAIKPQLKTLWDSCGHIQLERRFIPKGLDGKRLDLIPWISSNFDYDTTNNLLKFQELSFQITDKLLNSNNSRETKVKKLTIYRKMIAETIVGESYEKNSYNLIPYALFCFSDEGKIVKESNRDYTDRVSGKNTGENRIPMTEKLLKDMIKMAVADLRKKAETIKDYGSKMIALELLTGRRQYEELLNDACTISFRKDGKFIIIGLAKSSKDKKEKPFEVPYLGMIYEQYQGELAELLKSNLKLLRAFVSEKKELKTSLPVLLNKAILQASIAYDKLLIPVRKVAPQMPMIDGKSHTFRKLYAFTCYVMFDDCLSNESQYFAHILKEGTMRDDGVLNLNLITAKSYSVFRLVDEL